MGAIGDGHGLVLGGLLEPALDAFVRETKSKRWRTGDGAPNRLPTH
jgi:hypothetical protein